MTEKLILLINHVNRNRRDVPASRGLDKLLHQRRKMLAYTRKTDYHYYKWVIAEYNIPDIPPLNAHHRDHFSGIINKAGGETRIKPKYHNRMKRKEKLLK